MGLQGCRRDRKSFSKWGMLALALAMILPVTAFAIAKGPATGSAKSGAGKCLGKAATISGTSKNDVLKGTAGRDVIVAKGGEDRIQGRGGEDLICGGAGSDNINAGPGADTMDGEGGGDNIHGTDGRDRLIGSNGGDLLDGGKDTDSCEGGSGKNVFKGCEIADGTSPANRPPEAGRITEVTDEDTLIAVDVIALSTDADRDPLTLTAIDTSGTTGVVSGDGARTIRFDPAGQFEGLGAGQAATTSFGYTVSDGKGGTARGRVTMKIDGRDDPPIAVNDAATLIEDADPDQVRRPRQRQEPRRRPAADPGCHPATAWRGRDHRRRRRPHLRPDPRLLQRRPAAGLLHLHHQRRLDGDRLGRDRMLRRLAESDRRRALPERGRPGDRRRRARQRHRLRRGPEDDRPENGRSAWVGRDHRWWHRPHLPALIPATAAPTASPTHSTAVTSGPSR